MRAVLVDANGRVAVQGPYLALIRREEGRGQVFARMDASGGVDEVLLTPDSAEGDVAYGHGSYAAVWSSWDSDKVYFVRMTCMN